MNSDGGSVILLGRAPELRLELQLRDRETGTVAVACVPASESATPHALGVEMQTIASQRELDDPVAEAVCRHDLVVSIGLAAMYRRLRDAGRIGVHVEFRDFLAISEELGSPLTQIVREEHVLEFDSNSL